jgi:hypothetical protein
MNVQENQEMLELAETSRVLVCTDNNCLGKHKCHNGGRKTILGDSKARWDVKTEVVT